MLHRMIKLFYKNRSGVALIITMLMMSLLLFLAIYFLNFSVVEKRISQSQTLGVRSYYLAEAGVAEMIWRLKNDANYKNSFESDPAWTVLFDRQNPFGQAGESYHVRLTNTSEAHGEIISTGFIIINGNVISQRVIKTNVYRAMGEVGDIIEVGGYADGNIDISLSRVNFLNGNAHSNNVFTVNGLSVVEIANDLKCVGNFNKHWLSAVNVGGSIYAKNEPYTPAAQEIVMPAIDFNSSDPGSLKNRADKVYTQAQFDALMASNQNLIINDKITYVSGDVRVEGDQDLTINGLLVVENDFIVGNKYCRGSRCGASNLIINHIVGEPSGVLAKKKVNFETNLDIVNVHGVIYANDQLNVLSFPLGQDFDFYGGLIARKLTITSCWQPINITLDAEILTSALDITQFSPIITVEHWEEEY